MDFIWQVSIRTNPEPPEELFSKAMVLRMTDIARQSCSDEINTSSKLSTYKELKTLLNTEKNICSL